MTEGYCPECGWPVYLEWQHDRMEATAPDNDEGWHWRHTVEPAGHPARQGGEPNEKMQSILARTQKGDSAS